MFILAICYVALHSGAFATFWNSHREDPQIVRIQEDLRSAMTEAGDWAVKQAVRSYDKTTDIEADLSPNSTVNR